MPTLKMHADYGKFYARENVRPQRNDYIMQLNKLIQLDELLANNMQVLADHLKQPTIRTREEKQKFVQSSLPPIPNHKSQSILKATIECFDVGRRA
jgi:hypothetical protein